LRRLATVLVLLATPAVTIAQSCDSDCLEGVYADFEARIVAHEAKDLPVTQNFRMTENYRPIEPNQGFWTNIGEIHYRDVFADPVSGQVASIGFVDHDGRDAYFALRLKVEPGRKISQAEMFLVHKGEASFFEESRTHGVGAVYGEVVPESQRSTRDVLIQIADSFTDSWQYRNEDLAPYGDPCDFFENNVELTDPEGPAGDTCGGMVEYGGKFGIAGLGKSGTAGARRPEGQSATAGGEPDQPGGPPRNARLADPSIGRPALFGTQFWMRDRRYPVVDVEKGVVFFYHIQGGEPARPGEPVVYERSGGSPGAQGGPPQGQGNGAPPGQGNGPPPGQGSGAPMGGGGAAYMVALIKVIDGKIVRVDHFEREGGPNASGGFEDGPRW